MYCSRSSCAPRLRGAPDAGQEVDESRRSHKGAKEWCVRVVQMPNRRKKGILNYTKA